MGPLPRSAVMVVVGELGTSQRHPRDCLGVQNEPDTRGAHPRPRAHCPSHTPPQVMVHPICHA